jgi:2-keto-4-pentenoate hydratase
MTTDQTTPLARALAAARRQRRFHAYDALDAPDDPYRVQAEVASLTGTVAAGWKTGFGPDRDRTPIAGPIFASDLYANGETYRLVPGEQVLVEVELAVRLARDLPPGRRYSIDDILAASEEMLIGLELIGTRYAQADSAPFAARLADNLNNGAYVRGEGTRDFAALGREALPMRLWIDGGLVADQPGVHPDGDPLTGVAAWAGAQMDRMGGLREGQVITTGSLNTPVAISDGARIEAELAGLGRVRLEIVRSV